MHNKIQLCTHRENQINSRILFIAHPMQVPFPSEMVFFPFRYVQHLNSKFSKWHLLDQATMRAFNDFNHKSQVTKYSERCVTMSPWYSPNFGALHKLQLTRTCYALDDRIRCITWSHDEFIRYPEFMYVLHCNGRNDPLVLFEHKVR